MRRLVGRPSSSYKHGTKIPKGPSLHGRRHIQSKIGHRTAIEVLPGSNGIRLYRSDADNADAIVLDKMGTKILSAYLESVIVVGVQRRPTEEIDDDAGTVLSSHDNPAPLVRITQGERAMDVHAPSWDALRCEINLVIPRLSNAPAPSESRMAH